ncbi:MAG: LysM peptidoglycan-binding domain-containing protein [Anaerolineae bacterium]|nr:LysM peptidoglycan-binding domain-containing protein [Anaerolineae bacterium]
MLNKRMLLLLMALLAGFILATTSQAPQVLAQENLLVNPGFEGPYSDYVPNPPIPDCASGRCTTAQMAAGWWPWWVSQVSGDPDWKNRMPEYKPAEAPFTNRVHGGARAQQYFTFHSTHTAGLWQRVNVPANARLQFSIWGHAWSAADDEPFSNYPTPVNMRIGIDPTGGTNPFSPNIVWSGTANAYDYYVLFSVEAQAQGDAVTVFTYSAPIEARKHNDVYWDDASLTVIGAGVPAPPAGGGGASGSPAVLGPTPTPNAEGLILVVVQSGDSLWSVAARAGLTLDELLNLNPPLTRDSFVQPGQTLIIGRGTPGGSAAAPTGQGGGGSEEDEATTSETEEATPTELPEPTSTPLPTPEPTPAPPQGGAICLKAYDDANQNGLHDAGEGLRPGVAFTVTNADTQTVASNYITDATTDVYCLEGLTAGSYLITRSKGENERMTTPDNWAVSIADGTTTSLSFGSFVDTSAPVAVADTSTLSAAAESAAAGQGALTEAQNNTQETGSSGLITGIVIVVVILAVLLLVGVLAVILGARRHTV